MTFESVQHLWFCVILSCSALLICLLNVYSMNSATLIVVLHRCFRECGVTSICIR